MQSLNNAVCPPCIELPRFSLSRVYLYGGYRRSARKRDSTTIRRVCNANVSMHVVRLYGMDFRCAPARYIEMFAVRALCSRAGDADVLEVPIERGCWF